MPSKYPNRKPIPKEKLPKGFSEGYTDGRSLTKFFILKGDPNASQEVKAEAFSDSLRRSAGYFPFSERPYFPEERQYLSNYLLKRFKSADLRKPDGTALGQAEIDGEVIKGGGGLENYLENFLHFDGDSPEVLAAHMLEIIYRVERDIETIDQYAYHLETALTWTYRLGKIMTAFLIYEKAQVEQTQKATVPRKPRLNNLLQKYANDSLQNIGKSAAEYWDDLENDLANMRADPVHSGTMRPIRGGKTTPAGNCEYTYYEENDRETKIKFSNFKTGLSAAKSELKKNNR